MGTTVLPGDAIRLEDVMAHTAMTYPETYVREMTGQAIKAILEDVGDNLFNPIRITNKAGIWCGSAV